LLLERDLLGSVHNQSPVVGSEVFETVLRGLEDRQNLFLGGRRELGHGVSQFRVNSTNMSRSAIESFLRPNGEQN
jgi:hypothetical protein